MWTYEKKLQYPVKIKNPNPAMAKFIISQYGGPDGEIGASLRYLSQRYSMPYRKVAGVLTDVGTEEVAHRCYMSDAQTNIYAEFAIFPAAFLSAISLTACRFGSVGVINSFNYGF